MEQNKFEKEVQQKMDELKIHPADSVWEKIEARIEKKKHSNRGLGLLLLFFIFLAGGYLLWNTSHRSITETNNSGINSPEKKPGKISSENNKTVQPETNFNPGSITQPGNATANTRVKKSVNKNPSQYYKLPANKKINPGENTIVTFRQIKVTDDISEEIKAKIVDEQPQENVKNIEELKDSTYKNTEPGILPKSILKATIAKIKDTSKQALITSESTKHTKKAKWKVGILFSGGISKVGNSFLNEDKSAAVSDPNLSIAAPAPGIVLQPSATKAGFGFIIGTFAEKNIFSKTKLVLGINFKSFNTSNKVGIRNATTRLYNVQSNITNANDTYTNRYNFIELPVTLKVQIGKGKNVPLFWQGGVVISELISSNALQFDQSSIYYYNDNSIFNKTQFGLNTSISAAVFSKRKNSFLIGPYFYYDVSRLANEGLYNKKHFVFTGLRAEIIFGK
jgi:hypothetical protein